MGKPQNSDGNNYSEYEPEAVARGSKFDKLSNSVGNTHPNKVPQAPSSIPVSSVDEGNIPLNPGGEPHGYGSQADK